MPENTEILTGEVAIGHMVGTWTDPGLGMVNTEVDDGWLIIERGGGNYRTFLDLTSGTAVTIEDGDAGVSDLPELDSVGDSPTQEMMKIVQRVFGSQGGGSYPLPDEGVFSISFKVGDMEYRALHVGLLDDTFEVVDK